MHMGIYDRLLELARGARLTTYSEIAPLAGLAMNNDADRERISELLGEILTHEVSEGRPLLTAIVVHRGNDNNPGEGFFSIATELGRFNGSRDPLARLEFWVRQVQEVNGYWGNH
ncbi:hypothetical protein KKH27_02760 [bacterium]|nr:hypothetical protein [bacterium]